MPLIALSPDDVPPSDTPTDVPPLRCQHEGCQNSLTYGGRGRKPKYCDEHKPSPGNNPRQSSGGWSKAVQVETALTKYINGLAAGVMFVNVADGKVIAKGGPAVAHELVELAKIDKRLRKPLELMAMPGKYGPLTFATLSLVLPIMANHNMIPQFVIPTDGGKEANAHD